MNSRPKKQADIVVIGKGPLVNSVLSIVSHSHTKVLNFSNANKVHFLSRGVLAYGGEKVAAKRFLIVTPSHREIPVLKGQDLTKFEVLIHSADYKKSGSVIVCGDGELAIDAVMKMSAINSPVSLVYAGESLLSSYDISVQDVLTRYLKKLKIKLYSMHEPIASVTKSGRTRLLVKVQDSSKEMQCDNLYFEPSIESAVDIGLSNYDGFSQSLEKPVHSEKGLTVINSGRTVLSIEDAQYYANILRGKRARQPNYVLDNHAVTGEIEYFSFGVLEQQFMDTHIGYRKSIAKLTIPGSDVTGFIKVLVSLKRKVVGISGIVPKGYVGIETLRLAVKNQLKMDNLSRQIDVDDPFIVSYLELLRETA